MSWLEWIVDAFGDQKRVFEREEIEAICAIAKKLGMYPAILDRFPPAALGGAGH